MYKFRIGVLSSLLVFAAACSGTGTGLDIFSPQQEASEGLKFAAQVEQQQPMLNDPVLDRYINDLGQRMISQGVDNPQFHYTFKVVNSSEVNAFAIPGGHLYVNLALIKEAETEAEMVGVIGHEIGHVVHRHGTKRMTDALLLQVAAAGAQVAVGGEKGQLVGVGAMLFGQAGLLHYGRNAELEADQTGVQILYRTGYDVHALSRFFQKLLKIEQERGVRNGGLSQLLATHPPTADRIQRAESYIATLPKQANPKENSPEFERIRRYAAPLTPLKDTTVGKLDNDQTAER